MRTADEKNVIIKEYNCEKNQNIIGRRGNYYDYYNFFRPKKQRRPKLFGFNGSRVGNF